MTPKQDPTVTNKSIIESNRSIKITSFRVGLVILAGFAVWLDIFFG
jgi:hypothetical protein